MNSNACISSVYIWVLCGFLNICIVELKVCHTKFIVLTILWLVSSRCFATNTSIHIQKFFTFTNWNFIPIKKQLLFLLPLTSGNHHSISVPMNLTSFKTSYKWNPREFVLLCLAYFMRNNVLKVCPCHSMCQNLFPFKVEWDAIVCIHHLLFIHSSTRGHVCCLHLNVIFIYPFNSYNDSELEVPLLSSFYDKKTGA